MAGEPKPRKVETMDYKQKTGTLTDRAYYTTHAIMETMDIEDIRPLFISCCPTDFWTRNAYLALVVLQEFEAVFENSRVLSKIQDELWIDTEDFTSEELKDLFDNSAFADFLDFDFNDEFKMYVENYHPDVISIISNAIKEKVEVYEMDGHSNFFYPEAEPLFYIPKDHQ